MTKLSIVYTETSYNKLILAKISEWFPHAGKCQQMCLSLHAHVQLSL